MRGGRTILPGLIRPLGSNQRLDLARARAVRRGPNIGAIHSERTRAVAVLAGIGALVFAHQRAGLLGDRAHLLRAVAAHVEHRPHVQRADRGVRVPGAARAVLVEHPASAGRCIRRGARAGPRNPR